MQANNGEWLKMAKRMLDSMIKDGLSPEMIQANIAGLTEAYMMADIKKTEALTMKYFSNSAFRESVIMATAEQLQ